MAIIPCSSSVLSMDSFYERSDKVSAINVVKMEKVKSEKW